MFPQVTSPLSKLHPYALKLLSMEVYRDNTSFLLICLLKRLESINAVQATDGLPGLRVLFCLLTHPLIPYTWAMKKKSQTSYSILRNPHLLNETPMVPHTLPIQNLQ